MTKKEKIIFLTIAEMEALAFCAGIILEAENNPYPIDPEHEGPAKSALRKLDQKVEEHYEKEGDG